MRIGSHRWTLAVVAAGMTTAGVLAGQSPAQAGVVIGLSGCPNGDGLPWVCVYDGGNFNSYIDAYNIPSTHNCGNEPNWAFGTREIGKVSSIRNRTDCWLALYYNVNGSLVCGELMAPRSGDGDLSAGDNRVRLIDFRPAAGACSPGHF